MERKTPPEEVIFVGFWLTEARTTLRDGVTGYGGPHVTWALSYLQSAYSRVQAAYDALERDLENQGMLPSDGLYDVVTACQRLSKLPTDPMELAAIEHLIGRGHHKLARMMFKLGYRQITSADFDRLRRKHKLPGGGGSR